MSWISSTTKQFEVSVLELEDLTEGDIFEAVS